MIRAIIKPAKRMFSRRQQWVFEIRALNGERIDPRDTYYDRNHAIDAMELLFGNFDVELVVQDRFGNVESRRRLR